MLSPIDSEGSSTPGGTASTAATTRYPRLSIQASESDDAGVASTTTAVADASAAGLDAPRKSRSSSRSKMHNVVIKPRTVSRQHDAPASDALMRKLRRSASLARKKSATQELQPHAHLADDVAPASEPPTDVVHVPAATAGDRELLCAADDEPTPPRIPPASFAAPLHNGIVTPDEGRYAAQAPQSLFHTLEALEQLRTALQQKINAPFPTTPPRSDPPPPPAVSAQSLQSAPVASEPLKLVNHLPDLPGSPDKQHTLMQRNAQLGRTGADTAEQQRRAYRRWLAEHQLKTNLIRQGLLAAEVQLRVAAAMRRWDAAAAAEDHEKERAALAVDAAENSVSPTQIKPTFPLPTSSSIAVPPRHYSQERVASSNQSNDGSLLPGSLESGRKPGVSSWVSESDYQTPSTAVENSRTNSFSTDSRISRITYASEEDPTSPNAPRAFGFLGHSRPSRSESVSNGDGQGTRQDALMSPPSSLESSSATDYDERMLPVLPRTRTAIPPATKPAPSSIIPRRRMSGSLQPPSSITPGSPYSTIVMASSYSAMSAPALTRSTAPPSMPAATEALGGLPLPPEERSVFTKEQIEASLKRHFLNRQRLGTNKDFKSVDGAAVSDMHTLYSAPNMNKRRPRNSTDSDYVLSHPSAMPPLPSVRLPTNGINLGHTGVQGSTNVATTTSEGGAPDVMGTIGHPDRRLILPLPEPIRGVGIPRAARDEWEAEWHAFATSSQVANGPQQRVTFPMDHEMEAIWDGVEESLGDIFVPTAPDDAGGASATTTSQGAIEKRLYAAILQRRLLPEPSGGCPRCAGAAGEPIDATTQATETYTHFLFTCPVARLLWRRVAIMLFHLWSQPMTVASASASNMQQRPAASASAASAAAAEDEAERVSPLDVLLGFPALRRRLLLLAAAAPSLSVSSSAAAPSASSSPPAPAQDPRMRLLDLAHSVALASLLACRAYPRAPDTVAWSLFRARFERRLALLDPGAAAAEAAAASAG
ncbi:hypothetical protein HK405_013468 [Cladochytrium tenue]|nr:hypothetical protein HK405_013468 [Cladochytrium tenue]